VIGVPRLFVLSQRDRAAAGSLTCSLGERPFLRFSSPPAPTGGFEPSATERRPDGADFVLTHGHATRRLPAETARWSTITQIYEGTNQIQRMVMARQLLA
jgi:hypothetical protein